MTPDDDKTTIESAAATGDEKAPKITTMVIHYRLDMVVDRNAYYAVPQSEREEAIQVLEGKIYCPSNMDQIIADWAAGHDFNPSGGIGEAAHVAAGAAIVPYVDAACQDPAVAFPALGAGFDGVRYTRRNGHRVCIYDYRLTDSAGTAAAVFEGAHGINAEAVFSAEVEPRS